MLNQRCAPAAANGARTNHLMAMLSVLSKHVDKLQAAGDKAKCVDYDHIS
jgi:hypothetical protein